MNVMNQLTLRHMRLNRKRTIVTIIGIITSVAMITAVSASATSFMNLFQRMAKEASGSWIVQYDNVRYEDVDSISKELQPDTSFLTKTYGFSKQDGLKNEYKPYLCLKGFDSQALESMPITIIEGRIPKNSDEVIISEHIKTDGGIEYQVGDEITLQLGNRYVKESGKKEYLKKKQPYEEKETLEITSTKKVTVVGIMERPQFEPFSAAGYTMITYLDHKTVAKEDQVAFNCDFKTVTNDIYETVNQVASHYQIPKEDVTFNNPVLQYYGVSEYDTYNNMVRGFQLILVGIIMAGSISLIYNSFAISISERSRQFGMLASVGATKKQKRNAVFYEGTVLGIIAIPLGIVAGLGGMAITFAIISPMLMDFTQLDIPIRLVVSYESIAIAILFSIITIFISAYIPARRAAKITPMEAIRQVKDIKIRKRTVRTGKLTKLLFGFEGELAAKNLKRNRKRYRVLVFSMVVSLVLFCSVGSYVYYLTEITNIVYDDYGYDIAIGVDNEVLNDKNLKSLRESASVISADQMTYISGNFNLQLSKQDSASLLSKYGKEEIKECPKEYQDSFQFSVIMVGMDKTAYEMYYKKATGNKVRNNQNDFHGILINMSQDKTGYSITQIPPTSLKAGDQIQIQSVIFEEDGGKKTSDEKMVFTLDGVTKDLPMGSKYRLVEELIIVVPDDKLDSIGTYFKGVTAVEKQKILFVKTDGSKEARKQIKDIYGDDEDEIQDIAEEMKQIKQITLIFSIFAYGFITLISLICMANLMNTISTSFELRTKEFAMLKSVGMTPKSFRKMLRYESVLYGIKTLVFGLPISLFITWKIYSTGNTNFTTAFSFPVKTYAIGIISVLLVVGVAVFYSSNKVRKQNIIEGLKME